MIFHSNLDEELRLELTQEMRRQYEEEASNHTPSGKLSAGILGKPLLEQVLKIIGVPTKPSEDYALGLFRRGDSVEDTIIELLKPDKTQAEAEYDDCVGFIDAIKNEKVYEVKSIKNSQVPYLDPSNTKRVRNEKRELVDQYQGPKYAHALQGAIYALSENQDEFTIIYVAADDLRTYPHVIKTEDVKPEVNRIITEVKNQLAMGALPKWEPREDWQAKYPEYSLYPDWMTLDPGSAMKKLQTWHPEAHKKLTKGE